MASPYDAWRNNYGMPGPQDPRRVDEITATPAPRWEEILRGSDVSAIKQSPIMQAIGAWLSKPGAGVGEKTKLSPIDGRPMAPEPTALDNLPPTVQEGIGGLGLLANFLAPGVRLPKMTMAPEKGIGARPGPSALNPKAEAMGASLAETEGTVAPTSPSFKRHYQRVRDGAMPDLVHNPLDAAARPSGVPRTVWQQDVDRPWQVGQARFSTEAEARDFLARSMPDAIERHVIDAAKQKLSAIDTTEAFLKERGLSYSRSDAKSTSSKYLYVNMPDGNPLKLRFADHSRDAAFGGRSRTHTKAEWDLPPGLRGDDKAKIASALASISEHLMRNAPKPTGISGYHGSPHDFPAERLVKWPDGRAEYIVGAPGKLPDVPSGASVVKDYPLGRFRNDKIGTGEGAQAYGHGLYFAESEGVAKTYRDALGNYDDVVRWKGTQPPTAEQKRIIDQLSGFDVGRNRQPDLASVRTDITRAINQERMMEGMPGYDAAYSARRIDELRKQLEAIDGMKELIEIRPPGRMYEVNINADPERFLDFDAPLAEQPPAVRQALDKLMPQITARRDSTRDAINAYMGNTPPTLKPPQTPEDLFGTIKQQRYGPGEIEGKLREAGIPGIRYKDALSRGADGGTSNYVVFDANLIEILRKYGLLPPAAAAGASMLDQQEPPL